MRKASFTVEAALVLPVFIYGMYAIISIMQLFYIKEHVQNGLTQTGRELSRYAFAEIYQKEEAVEKEKQSLVDIVSVQLMLRKNLDNNIISDRWIMGGTAGVLCGETDDMEEENRISLFVTYYFRPLCPVLHTYGVKITQQVITRKYVGAVKTEETAESDAGKDTEDENKEIVYVAENGVVYHVTEACTHLKLSIEEVSYSQMEQERNESGSRYKPCEKCCEGEADKRGTYYITKEGDRYHCRGDCSGLKRTVYEVPLQEAEDKKKCSKCG